jgi:hypothetical protein
MGGGLLQLVAYGAQDAYLSGNPHITFWKILYKRHTNFAMEAMRVNFTGAPVYGQRVVAVVNRNADLIWKTYVEITLPDTGGSTPDIQTDDIRWSGGARRRLGYLLLQQIEVEIGGQIIDRHYGEWLYLWETLTTDFDTAMKLDTMVGGQFKSFIFSDMWWSPPRSVCPSPVLVQPQPWSCSPPHRTPVSRGPLQHHPQ